MWAAGTDKLEPSFLQYCWSPLLPTIQCQHSKAQDNTEQVTLAQQRIPGMQRSKASMERGKDTLTPGCSRLGRLKYLLPHPKTHLPWHYTCKSTDALQECSSCAFEGHSCFPDNFISSALATTHTFLYTSFSVYTVVYLQPDLHQEDLCCGSWCPNRQYGLHR